RKPFLDQNAAYRSGGAGLSEKRTGNLYFRRHKSEVEFLIILDHRKPDRADSPTRFDHERESDFAARKSFPRSFELDISARRRQTAVVEKCRGFELIVANRDNLWRGDERQRSDFQKTRAMRGEQRQLR